MASLPFDPTASAASGIARPRVTLKVGGGEASESGIGGAIAAAAAALGVGGASGLDQHLIAFELTRGFAPWVDVLELLVAAVPGAPAVAIDDALELSIADASGKTVVLFKGRVGSIVDRDTRQRTVRVANVGQRLAGARSNRSFQQQNTDDILEVLASDAGAALQVNGNAPTLPRYVVDDSRNHYEHAAHLCALSGRALLVDAKDELVVRDLAATGGATASFAFGRDLLSYSLSDRADVAGERVIVGEGAAGDEGADAWSWLRKDSTPMRARYGGSASRGTRVYGVPELRAIADVEAYATARGARLVDDLQCGELAVVGSPAVLPGDRVNVSGLPDASRNGGYRVLGARHSFDGARGFVTQISVARLGAGSTSAGSAASALGGLL